MTIANFTGEENHTQTFSRICSAGRAAGIHGELIFISAFNIFLSITAILGNTLILVSLRKESSLHPTSKLLLCCLATTDLCVGLIAEPLNVAYWVFLLNEDWDFCWYAFSSNSITSYTLCSVSLLTVTVISVDRLLALSLGLRYRHVVTLYRTYVIVAIVWIVPTVASSLYFTNRLITIWYGNIAGSLCLGTSIGSYCKIYYTLWHHQTEMQSHAQDGQPNPINPLNIARYKRAVSSALWVQCTLVACYLPYAVASFLYSDAAKRSLSGYLILDFTATLIYFNSSINPLLYCWKISEVKQTVKQTIRDALFCPPS